MKKEGISLITLIITIVVVIILSTVVILNIKDDNVIYSAKKAQIAQTLDTFKSELSIKISDKFFEDTSIQVSDIYSRNEDEWRITDLVPSIKGTEYESELIVINGKLKLKKDSSFPEEKQKIIIEFLGEIEEDGELGDNDKTEEIIPEQKTYQITYDVNGGNEAFENQTKNQDEILILNSNVPTKEGYIFEGWKATDETIYQAGEEYTKNEGTVLTAQWTIKQYTLTFNANGGSCSITSITKEYESTITLPTPNKYGYSFIGWYTDLIGGSKVAYTTMPAYNQTLYARWQKTITVNAYLSSKFHTLYSSGTSVVAYYQNSTDYGYFTVSLSVGDTITFYSNSCGGFSRNSFQFEGYLPNAIYQSRILENSGTNSCSYTVERTGTFTIKPNGGLYLHTSFSITDSSGNTCSINLVKN